MSTIVVYRSQYGSTKKYAEWIGEELSCPVRDGKGIKLSDLSEYDTIIWGGGLYGETIAGVNMITKNLDVLSKKKLIVFSTGITPVECREYYDDLVLKKNFKPEMLSQIKVYNFPGKMVIDELSIPHKAALKMLKKIMSSKENPTELEKMLVTLCDTSGDFSDRSAILNLCEYARD